jgi:hypothetical protein
MIPHLPFVVSVSTAYDGDVLPILRKIESNLADYLRNGGEIGEKILVDESDLQAQF